MNAKVVSVGLSGHHGFHKRSASSINLIAGEGVEGDAHCGITVKHRSRVAKDPSQPNLRQVHIIHEELLMSLREKGFELQAGSLGENILTAGLDLLALPTGSLLKIGAAQIAITGLRNPCKQLNDFQPGLMQAVLDHDSDGNLIRLAGVMGIVEQGGEIRPEDRISVSLPAGEHRRLAPV